VGPCFLFQAILLLAFKQTVLKLLEKNRKMQRLFDGVLDQSELRTGGERKKDSCGPARALKQGGKAGNTVAGWEERKRLLMILKKEFIPSTPLFLKKRDVA